MVEIESKVELRIVESGKEKENGRMGREWEEILKAAERGEEERLD